MPLNSLPATTTVEALTLKRTSAAGQAHVDFRLWGGIAGGGPNNPQTLPHIAPLAAAGVPGFKAFLLYPGCDGLGLLDEPHLRAALPLVAATGLPLLIHAELPGPLHLAAQRLAVRNPDWHTYATYLASRPDESELAAIRLLIDLSRELAEAGTPARIHIVHLSTALALPMLREARAEALPITVETCPHYLHFAAESIPDGATLHKCAPPIRSAANRQQLWQALHDRTIDLIASDHSPCPPEMKTPHFDTSWGGIASLSLGPAILWSGMQSRPAQNWTLEDLARLMATAPATLAGLSARKGQITPGHDADLVIFAPEETFTVSEASLHFRHPVSPYLGQTLTGVVHKTILRGRCIFNRGNLPRPASRPRDRALMQTPDLHAANAYTLDLCTRIAAHTDVPGTITRLFLSPATRQVHTLLLTEMHALGMRTHTDALGNLHGLYPGINPLAPTLLVGSHIDTVPNAGPYDGILGVALPLALLRALHATGTRLPYTFHLIAFSEEEGVRFQLPFLGSRFFTNTLLPEALERADAEGITLREACLTLHTPPWQSSRSAAEGSAFASRRPAAFLELHIEQGPVLDSLALPLGIVTAIAGQSRYTLTFTGQANHAGTTPMHLRRDSLTAAAAFITSVETRALTQPSLVATVGTITATPGATNIIPGETTLSLDIRHPADFARLEAASHLLAEAHRIAATRNLILTTAETSSQSAVPMHPGLQLLLAKSAIATGHPAHPMPSGAGHDAMILAEAGIPTAMLFLRSPNGLSHHPEESVRPEDILAALETLHHFLVTFQPETLP